MRFFISDAFAEAAPAASQQEPGMAGLILPIAVLVIFFLLFVLPQNRRQREHKKLLQSLTKGSEVVTTGGLLGRVVELDENFVTLEVADNVHIAVQRHAIGSLMPKGTYKAAKRKPDSK